MMRANDPIAIEVATRMVDVLRIEVAASAFVAASDLARTFLVARVAVGASDVVFVTIGFFKKDVAVNSTATRFADGARSNAAICEEDPIRDVEAKATRVPSGVEDAAKERARAPAVAIDASGADETAFVSKMLRGPNEATEAEIAENIRARIRRVEREAEVRLNEARDTVAKRISEAMLVEAAENDRANELCEAIEARVGDDADLAVVINFDEAAEGAEATLRDLASDFKKETDAAVAEETILERLNARNNAASGADVAAREAPVVFEEVALVIDEANRIDRGDRMINPTVALDPSNEESFNLTVRIVAASALVALLFTEGAAIREPAVAEDPLFAEAAAASLVPAVAEVPVSVLKKAVPPLDINSAIPIAGGEARVAPKQSVGMSESVVPAP